MLFDDIRGENRRVFDKLKSIAASGMVSHAYIIEGDTSTAKEDVAMCFAKAILCKEHRGAGCESCIVCSKIEHGNYEDLFLVEKTENSIKDADISGLQERLKIRPLGERNIAIIKDADTMTVWAQNRLLKTLEEPPAGTVIMLLSENTEELLPTIVSRCTVIRLVHSGGHSDAEIDSLAREFASALIANKPVYHMKKLIDGVTADKDSAYEFLDALENVYGDILKSDDENSRLYPKPYIYDAISQIEESRRDLKRNIATGYVIKNLIIKIGG